MNTDLFGEPIPAFAKMKRANLGKYFVAPSIPYQGNKNTISAQIIHAMPKCNHFLDACCGGGVIGYSMKLYGRAEAVTMNDAYTPLIDLHRALADGTSGIDFEHPQFVTRAMFY